MVAAIVDAPLGLELAAAPGVAGVTDCLPVAGAPAAGAPAPLDTWGADGTADAGRGADPWPALGAGGVDRNGAVGTDTDGTGTDGTEGVVTDGVVTDGVVTDGVLTDGVLTDGVETCAGTPVPAGVGIVTEGAATGTERSVALRTERAPAVAAASAVAMSTLKASERAILIVRDMCAETHRVTKTCANLYGMPQTMRDASA